MQVLLDNLLRQPFDRSLLDGLVQMGPRWANDAGTAVARARSPELVPIPPIPRNAAKKNCFGLIQAKTCADSGQVASNDETIAG